MQCAYIYRRAIGAHPKALLCVGEPPTSRFFRCESSRTSSQPPLGGSTQCLKVSSRSWLSRAKLGSREGIVFCMVKACSLGDETLARAMSCPMWPRDSCRDVTRRLSRLLAVLKEEKNRMDRTLRSQDLEYTNATTSITNITGIAMNEARYRILTRTAPGRWSQSRGWPGRWDRTPIPIQLSRFHYRQTRPIQPLSFEVHRKMA